MAKQTKRLKSVPFERILKWLHQNHDCLPVFLIGGRNHFDVYYVFDDKLFIKGSKNAGFCVDRAMWNEVMNYMDNLDDDESWKTESYDMKHLPKVVVEGNVMFGPNFLAICKAYWCYHSK